MRAECSLQCYVPDPCGPAAVQVIALEASLVRWLLEMGAISKQLAAAGFGAVAAQLVDGVFLCWLAQRLSGTSIMGVNRKPLTEAHR